MALPDIAGQAQGLSTLEQLYLLQDTLSAYVIKNILLVGASPLSKIVPYINPNLYKIAVTYYGDADLWTAIARANNFTDPVIFNPGVTYNLLIPPKPGTSTGGILNPV